MRDLLSRTTGLVLVSFIASACGGGGSPAGPSSPVPTPTPAPATIGPAGGTLTVATGAARLVVPAGALATEVALTLRPATPVPLDPHAVGGSAWTLAPAGTTFAVPATLTIPYDVRLGPSGVDESELRVHVLNGDEWQSVASATAPQAGEASATLTTSGTFGVSWRGPTGACSSAADHEFDFWLGEWNWTQGNLGGATNDITKEGGGCLIEEHYRDPQGVVGRSVSLFSRLDQRWHQTYIDSQGSRIVLVGRRDGDRMVLDESATQRSVWDPLDPDTIRFYSERTSNGGASWSFVFDGRYTRR
jgi:hypothetical protein